MIEKKCAYCKKLYKRRKSSIGKYCSWRCYHATRIGVKRPEHAKKMMGKNNPRWLNKPNGGLDNLHQWLHRRIPRPSVCVMCKKVKPYDLANISGNYLHSLDDWMWICRKCHFKYDKKIANFFHQDKSRPYEEIIKEFKEIMREVQKRRYNP